MLEHTGQADALEITDEMIAAGISAAQEMRLGQPLRDLVYEVYSAMATEASSCSSPRL